MGEMWDVGEILEGENLKGEGEMDEWVVEMGKGRGRWTDGWWVRMYWSGSDFDGDDGVKMYWSSSEMS